MVTRRALEQAARDMLAAIEHANYPPDHQVERWHNLVAALRPPRPAGLPPWWHLHWDAHWRNDGIFGLYQCRCGARRVRRVNYALMGPIPHGWPPLEDRHGGPVNDSGWHHA